jgi:BASS family bile acid:Na+ symporter
MAKGRLPNLHGLGFALSVAAAVALAMVWPELFRTWGSFETRVLIVPLIQLIMFGMGTTLSVADFARVLKMPWPVLVGIVLQFGVMPFVGWLLATGFGFPPLVAAGVVLVGSCPGGVASNVITYLAGGNVALSVTMTASSTLLSPLMTPLMMKLLAGQFVPVDFWQMMLSIIKMIVVPIVLGLIANRLLHGRAPWIKRGLPFVSMAGIAIIIGIITSLNRDTLADVALALLVVVVVVHNAVGYVLGYGGARLLGLSERDARTVAIEVGLQNAGMATGLAMSPLNSPEAGLAPAIFGPWMNVSGAVLASFWRRRPTEPSMGQGPHGPKPA